MIEKELSSGSIFKSYNFNVSVNERWSDIHCILYSILSSSFSSLYYKKELETGGNSAITNRDIDLSLNAMTYLKDERLFKLSTSLHVISFHFTSLHFTLFEIKSEKMSQIYRIGMTLNAYLLCSMNSCHNLSWGYVSIEIWNLRFKLWDLNYEICMLRTAHWQSYSQSY
jgi:hypothetical protein